MPLRVTDYRALVAYCDRLSPEQVTRAMTRVRTQTGLDVTAMMRNPFKKLPRVLVALAMLSLDPAYPLRTEADRQLRELSESYRRLRELGVPE